MSSPYTNPIPAGTANCSFNVPSAVHLRFLEEAKEDDLCLGDWLLKNVLIGETVSNDAAAAKAIADDLVRHRPRKAWLFGAGFIGWINPLNLIQGRREGAMHHGR